MINFQSCALTVRCPNCKKKLDAPDKKIENALFYLAVYTCPDCGNHFKVSY